MASKSHINTMATLAIANAQINVLLSELTQEDLEKIRPALDQALACLDEAFSAYGRISKLSPKDMDRMRRILDRFHGYVKSLEIEEFTSTALALLETLLAKIRDKDRRRIIKNVIEAFYRVHEFFDPDLAAVEAYYKSADLETRWREIVEAA
ncbi:MAG: hypothetical protein RBT11_14110 [Desulfobacterales bacterium]|nr:hypothetical protein [Desulfobacterales bacterium]